MATRHLLPSSVRDTLLGIPSDTTSLERDCVLAYEDLGLIGTRRRAANRLGLAVHIALPRHPDQGWLEDTNLPGPLLLWLAEQIAVPVSVLTGYGIRGATRTSRRQLATRHLGPQPFVPRDDMVVPIELAARAAFDTDDGRLILERLTSGLKALRYVLPGAVRLKRVGLAGRARARRLSAQALNDALEESRKDVLARERVSIANYWPGLRLSMLKGAGETGPRLPIPRGLSPCFSLSLRRFPYPGEALSVDLFHLLCGKGPADRSQPSVPSTIERIAARLTSP